jgi:hypothetical protein
MVGITADMARRFGDAVPRVKTWIVDVLQAHAQSAMPASTLEFARISHCFPLEFLEVVRVIEIDEVPRPPLDRFGLPELSRTFPLGTGLTLNDTYFIARPMRTVEGLHFHELVHVAQWRHLGMDRFLLAYAAGLMEFGYRQNPLENMAYKLQGEFENGKSWANLLGLIEKLTDDIWGRVAGAFPA